MYLYRLRSFGWEFGWRRSGCVGRLFRLLRPKLKDYLDTIRWLWLRPCGRGISLIHCFPCWSRPLACCHSLLKRCNFPMDSTWAHRSPEYVPCIGWSGLTASPKKQQRRLLTHLRAVHSTSPNCRLFHSAPKNFQPSSAWQYRRPWSVRCYFQSRSYFNRRMKLSKYSRWLDLSHIAE